MVKVAQYSWPDVSADFELHAARYQFLRYLDEERPEVREDLEGPVRTAYTSMFDLLDAHAEGAPVSRKAPNWDDVYESDHFLHWLDQPGSEFEGAVDPFLSALKSWIEEYHLTAPWLGDAAIRTIRAVESDLNWERLPSWVIRSPGIPHGLTWGELEFQFRYQFWLGPTIRTRRGMRDEVRGEFDKALNAWFQDLDEILKKRGYKRNLRWDDPNRDIRWLVRFQCVGEEFADIAQGQNADTGQGQKKVTPDAVRKAVGDAAKYLGIKPREARRGRPPKKRRA